MCRDHRLCQSMSLLVMSLCVRRMTGWYVFCGAGRVYRPENLASLRLFVLTVKPGLPHLCWMLIRVKALSKDEWKRYRNDKAREQRRHVRTLRREEEAEEARFTMHL